MELLRAGEAMGASGAAGGVGASGAVRGNMSHEATVSINDSTFCSFKLSGLRKKIFSVKSNFIDFCYDLRVLPLQEPGVLCLHHYPFFLTRFNSILFNNFDKITRNLAAKMFVVFHVRHIARNVRIN